VVKKMIYVTTVNITQEMIDQKPTIDMSTKQGNRIIQLLPHFKEQFGDIRTQIVDLETVPDVVHLVTGPMGVLDSETHLTHIQSLAIAATSKTTRTTLSERSGLSAGCTLADLITVLRSDPSSLSIAVHGRSLPPTTLTSHSCGPEILRTNLIASTYYQRTGPPKQPEEQSSSNTCRFDASWTTHFDGLLSVTAILKMTHTNYDGYFVALGNTSLPDEKDPEWCLGAGMYPTDLRPDYHEYRELWQTHHTAIRPLTIGAKPAIGVFLHSGQRYTLTVNGSERVIRA
jgi:hypothetical protein